MLHFFWKFCIRFFQLFVCILLIFVDLCSCFCKVFSTFQSTDVKSRKRKKSINGIGPDEDVDIEIIYREKKDNNFIICHPQANACQPNIKPIDESKGGEEDDIYRKAATECSIGDIPLPAITEKHLIVFVNSLQDLGDSDDELVEAVCGK